MFKPSSHKKHKHKGEVTQMQMKIYVDVLFHKFEQHNIMTWQEHSDISITT